MSETSTTPLNELEDPSPSEDPKRPGLGPGVSSALVIAGRAGAVLGKHTILKSDHFPGCQNKRLAPQIEGAPNFRQVAGMPVYGVAIPTLAGLRRVLDAVGARDCAVLWHNMREEPVLYIGGRPYVLREAERPFTNLEYTGITKSRVESMELRLKEDVLREAGRYGGAVLVSDELPDGRVVDTWESVSGPEDLHTPAEVYAGLVTEGYKVTYCRVPVTDEKAPKERDFDELVGRVTPLAAPTALLFNCQMGRGRTTTGMIISALLTARLRPPAAPLPPLPPPSAPPAAAAGDAALLRGEYSCVRSLLRVLEGGAASKRRLDDMVDRCAAMQNLREAILAYRQSLSGSLHEWQRAAAFRRGIEYLERYFLLIAFTAYIYSEDFEPATPAPSTVGAALDGAEGVGPQTPTVTFEQWMRARPELASVRARMLWRNPLSALSHSGAAVPGGSAAEEGPRAPATVVATRAGAVLGPNTLLKADHFPGCQHPELPALVEGAPNFRQARHCLESVILESVIPESVIHESVIPESVTQVESLPVYGVAIPTVDGAMRVLQAVGARPGGAARALWANMREEPVLYIRGKPYVLREAGRPFKNLQEYTGIDTDRLQAMELRLKADALREAAAYGGAVMVSHELPDGQVSEAWETITGPGDLLTPAELYAGLQAQGFAVDYARIPITDGRAPKARDFDSLAWHIKHALAQPGAVLIFSCQAGHGRTTLGTVVGGLMCTLAPRLPPHTLEEGGPLSPQHYRRSDSGDLANLGETGAANDRLNDRLTDRLTDRGLDRGRASDRSSHGGVTPGGMTPPSLPGSAQPGSSGPPPPASDGRPESGWGDRPWRPDEDLRRGGYGVVRRLVRLLEGGAESKRRLDGLVDAAGRTFNLREAILGYRNAALAAKSQRGGRRVAEGGAAGEGGDGGSDDDDDDERRDEAGDDAGGAGLDEKAAATGMARGLECLERYCMLLAFANWLDRGGLHSGARNFATWFANQANLRQMRRELRQHPMAALECSREARAALSSHGAHPYAGAVSGRRHSVSSSAEDPPDVAAAAAAAIDPAEYVDCRGGSVLAAGTILKCYRLLAPRDPAPGMAALAGVPALVRCKSHGLENSGLEGPGLPVWAAATPTAVGLKALLHRLGAAPHVIGTGTGTPEGVGGGGGGWVVLSDLREAPVVYVRGAPFVLRETAGPKGDALRTSGIEGPAVELIEVRLKQELLAEASRAGGSALLHRETLVPGAVPAFASTYDPCRRFDAAPGTAVEPFWEAVGPAEVLTPREVIQALIADGWRVRYRRIPQTRSRYAEAVDVDLVHRQLGGAGAGGEQYVFMSHTGVGSVAYAMNLAVTALMAAPPAGAVGGGAVGPAPSPEVAAVAEHRDVLSLLRVLKRGPQSKDDVDIAVGLCSGAGSLLDDFAKCRATVAASPPGSEAATAAHVLGLNYLRRYCYLIAFRSFLLAKASHLTRVPSGRAGGGGAADAAAAATGKMQLNYSLTPIRKTWEEEFPPCWVCGESGHLARKCPGSFVKWMAARPEIAHLLDNLKLS